MRLLSTPDKGVQFFPDEQAAVGDISTVAEQSLKFPLPFQLNHKLPKQRTLLNSRTLLLALHLAGQDLTHPVIRSLPVKHSGPLNA